MDFVVFVGGLWVGYRFVVEGLCFGWGYIFLVGLFQEVVCY